MNSVEFLKACARRWYVLLAGLLVTAAAAYVAAGPTVVYSTATTVNIMEPDAGKVRIVGVFNPSELDVANVLTARVNGGVHTPLASDPDVTLESIGILQGSHAQIRNVGGQWLSQVTEPLVAVQAVGPTEQSARSQLNAKVADVGTQLTQLEDQLKVPTKQRLELSTNPSQPTVTREVTSHGRALVGYGLFGLGLTLCAVWWSDRILARRAARRGGTGARRRLRTRSAD